MIFLSRLIGVHDKEIGMTHRITTVISFSTNEFRYLPFCVKGVESFSEKIIVVTGSHFFDGSPESRELLHKAYAEYPHCQFIEFTFDEDHPYGWNPPQKELKVERLHHWQNTKRYLAMCYLPEETQYILFLDVDEVMDGKRVEQWLDQEIYRDYGCMHFFAYRYQFLPTSRSRRYMNTALLVKRGSFDHEELFNPHERPGFFKGYRGNKLSGVLGLDGLPMIHHYSWVKTQGEIKKKINTWGHRYDRDWNLDLDLGFSNRREIFGFEDAIDAVPFCDPLGVDVAHFAKERCYRDRKIETFTNVERIDPIKLKFKLIRSIL